MESKTKPIEEVLSFIDGWYISLSRKEVQTDEEKLIMGVLNDIEYYAKSGTEVNYGKKESKQKE